MLESKSLTVSTSMENETIDYYQKFGWSLLSSQEIYNKNSVDLGDSVETTTVNYVKLVFQRDTSIPNYKRIKELEQTYDNLLNEEPRSTLIPFMVHLIIGCILLFTLVIPGVVYFIIIGKKRSDYKKEFNSRYAAYSEKFEIESKKIFDELESLV